MSFLKSLYYNYFPGNTVVHRLFWKYRYLFKNNIINEDDFQINLNHPHRQEIIKEFNKFRGTKKIIELGSSWGPNLFLLANHETQNEFVGIDVSKKMVDLGSRFFKSKGISNIHLMYGDIMFLENFKNNEFELLITDASLIYIDKYNILKCAEQMVRISSLGMILIEFDDDDDDPLGKVYQSNWIRDYDALFKQHASKIEKRRIDDKIWSGKWSEHGKIITIFLDK